MEDYVDQYFARQGVNPETQQAFFEEIYNNLDQGIDEGWSLEQGLDIDTKDFHLIQQLKHNAAVFSIFKKHDYDKELVKLLIDEDGALRSKASFVEEASKLNDKHLKRWFATEYDHAVATANQARKWSDYEKEAHLYPNLIYRAVMDERTREQHELWNHIVLPINHPFWDTHYPPNDWGCRCDADQTNEPVNDKGLNLATIPNLPKVFNTNVGKTGDLFKNHPYQDIKDPEVVKQLLQQVESWKLRNPQYKQLSKLIQVSRWADPADLDINLNYARKVSESFDTPIKIRPHSRIPGVKNPEYEINNLPGELKSVTSNSSLNNRIAKARKQGSRSIILSLDEWKDFNQEEFAGIFKSKFNRVHNTRFEEVYLVRGDKSVKITKAQFTTGQYQALEELK